MTFLRSLVLVLVLAGVLRHVPDVAAQNAPAVSREYQLKARMIEILGKSVTWPAGAEPSDQNPLIIGVLGKDLFLENGANQLDATVAAAKAKGTKLAVQRFPSADDFSPCHILFVSSQAAAQSKEKTLDERLKAAQGKTAGSPVLLVGESGGLARQGAIVNLVFDRTKNRIQLEINPDAASRANLKISPELLRSPLVRIVRDPPS